MKPAPTSLKFLERIARSRQLGMLLIGGWLVIFYLGTRHEARHEANPVAAGVGTARVVAA